MTTDNLFPEQQAPQDDAPGFDWSDRPEIAIYEQPMTAVYWNPRGALVIRQRAACGRCDEDQFVYIDPKHIDDLLAAISDLRGAE